MSPGVSDAELRSAYRRLVRLHHPDHNGGSLESKRRFEEVQEAYARIRSGRKAAPPPRQTQPGDPGLDARLADIERELREAQRARQEAERARQEAERARRDAERVRREAQRDARAGPGDARGGSGDSRRRPSDEELGYITTDDSFTKIAADVWDELSERFSEAREHPAVKRVEDLIDELQGHRRPRN